MTACADDCTAAGALRLHLITAHAAVPARADALRTLQRRVGGRIHLIQIPQSPRGGAADRRARPRWPAITIRQISAARAAAQTGPVRLAAVRLQVDVWSRTNLDEAAEVAELLRRALDGHRGTLAGRRVDRIALEGEGDEFDAASARRLWRRRQDWRIWIDDR